MNYLNQGAKEMTEEVRKVATKPEDLSSIKRPEFNKKIMNSCSIDLQIKISEVIVIDRSLKYFSLS